MLCMSMVSIFVNRHRMDSFLSGVNCFIQEEAVALRLQLVTERSEIDRLQQQLNQTEATMRHLEVKLNTCEV